MTPSLTLTKADFELALAEFSILCGAISMGRIYRRAESKNLEDVGVLFLAGWPLESGARSVYFATVNSAVKIGVSSEPRKRVIELNCRPEKGKRPPGVGLGEAAVALEVTGCNGRHERWLHSLLRRDMVMKTGRRGFSRRRTEWFSGSAVQTLMSMACSRAQRVAA